MLYLHFFVILFIPIHFPVSTQCLVSLSEGQIGFISSHPDPHLIYLVISHPRGVFRVRPREVSFPNGFGTESFIFNIVVGVNISIQGDSHHQLACRDSL